MIETSNDNPCWKNEEIARNETTAIARNGNEKVSLEARSERCVSGLRIVVPYAKPLEWDTEN